MNKKKYIILTVISVLSFILLTAGVTYSFFSYIGEGSTENTVESGSIKFIYEEIDKMGNGISITDAMPVSDSEGKASNNYFDFKVKSSTGTTIAIPYEITTRVVDGSDDLSDYVKLYLTKVNGNSEQQVALSIYSDLNDSTNTLAQPFGDKTLYNGEVLVGSTNYVENYRLRMWLNNDTNDGSVLDYSPVYTCSDTQYTNQTDCESNNGVWNPTSEYNNQGKTFSIKVNVYANGEQASQQKITSANNAEIDGIVVNNVAATESTDTTDNYDYYSEVEYGTTNANIDIETTNPDATVTIEKIDTTAFNTNIKRLSTRLEINNLTDGDNYYKITVTSKNKATTKEYILKVKVKGNNDATLSSLSISDCPLNTTFNPTTTSYTCVTEEGSVVPTYTTTSTAATVTVNGGTNLQTGTNTITLDVLAGDGVTTNRYTITVTSYVNTKLLSQAIFDEFASGNKNNVQTGPSSIKAVDTGTGRLLKSTTSQTSDSSKPTYYFRGNVTKNYVSFAGFTWRVIRINEDGTIRLIMENGINSSKTYYYHNNRGIAFGVYYTYAEDPGYAKTELEKWYKTNITNKGYSDKIVSGAYFCEQAKVKLSGFSDVGSAAMTANDSYTPTYKCVTDGNGYGKVTAAVGLITYEEALFAGGYYGNNNTSYYLYSGGGSWSMTPAGQSNATVWYINSYSKSIGASNTSTSGIPFRPVINVKADTRVTGTGSSTTPWAIQ